MNYYERHIGDYIKDTVSLTMLEDGAYNRLIDQYYQSEKPLPLDRKEVYREARATSATERKAVDYVLGKFFDEGPEGFVQKRIVAEIARYQDKQRKAKASADARWNKDKTTSDGNANASSSHDASGMRSHSEGNAHQTPDTSNHSSSLRSEESAGKPASRPKGLKTTLKTYLEKCKQAGVKPLPADHPVRDYCRDAGISDDMLAVAWCVFRDDYTQTATMKNKKYVDWPGHFANAVKGCWAKLWWTDGNTVAWTSRGQQEKAVLDARAKARETAHEPA